MRVRNFSVVFFICVCVCMCVCLRISSTFQSHTSPLTWIKVGYIHNTALKTSLFLHVCLCKDEFVVPYDFMGNFFFVIVSVVPYAYSAVCVLFQLAELYQMLLFLSE